MPEFLSNFIATFIPLFIVIDAFGNLPFVLSLSEKMLKPERHRMIHIATLTAAIVGLIFLFFGQLILKVMGISVGAFAIAGGLILLLLSLKYMISGHTVEAVKEEMVAVVPIGTPLTVGPATITTLLILVTQYQVYMVLLSFIVNMGVTWGIFMMSNLIVSFLGQGGIRAISRVFSLLLAALAVTMILNGLQLTGIVSLNP